VEVVLFEEEVVGDLWVVVGDDLVGFDVDDCWYGDFVWVVREVREVCFLELFVVEYWVLFVGVEVEGLVVFVVGWFV